MIALILMAGVAMAVQGESAIPASAPRGNLSYEEIARRFLVDHGLAGARREDVSLPEILRTDFIRADVGLFELRMPALDLERRESAGAFRDICESLFSAQRIWLEWIDPTGTETAQMEKDLDTLERWAGRWKVSAFAEPDGRGVYDIHDASDKLRAAQQRVRAGLLAGDGLGGTLSGSKPISLVLMPTRAQFVEFLNFVGWLRPELASHYWVAGTDRWMHFFLDEMLVYALEFKASGNVGNDYTRGESMNARNPRGMVEQITHLALDALLDRQYDGALPSAFASGLSMNLVIDQFGEVDTRIDGDLSGRQTERREVFVPGGRSEGGRLPRHDADSRWRVDQGKHHFRRVLRAAQKAGASERKRSGNRVAHFLLESRSGHATHVVTAPVLGSHAADRVGPPSRLEGDYLEFLRSYKSAFLYWLREDGSGSRRDSNAAFAGLLRAMADASNARDFEATVEEIYGSALSNSDANEDCLEGRFLKWLSRR